jgi:hypothetical protein
MRTTLNLDDDLLRVLRSIAQGEDRTVSEVASDLIRRALRPEVPDIDVNGFPVFEVSEQAELLTPDQVREALEEA